MLKVFSFVFNTEIRSIKRIVNWRKNISMKTPFSDTNVEDFYTQIAVIFLLIIQRIL